jgi:hypothetical protein
MCVRVFGLKLKMYVWVFITHTERRKFFHRKGAMGAEKTQNIIFLPQRRDVARNELSSCS